LSSRRAELEAEKQRQILIEAIQAAGDAEALRLRVGGGKKFIGMGVAVLLREYSCGGPP
jgi:hypothetical protein